MPEVRSIACLTFALVLGAALLGACDEEGDDPGGLIPIQTLNEAGVIIAPDGAMLLPLPDGAVVLLPPDGGVVPVGANDASGPSGPDAARTDSGPSAQGDGSIPTNPGDGGVTSGKCSAKLPAISDDPGARGPWDVGVRTAKVGRLTVEVFYPAKPGSAAGAKEVSYEVRETLPMQERAKVPADRWAIDGKAYRDLPIDDQYGPYPVVMFIHGTASFRFASASTNAHWASRGFVVLAADYPGLGLVDQLGQACGYPLTGDQDIPKDFETQLSALKPPSGDLAFLANRIDLKQLGVAGHSQGGCVSSQLGSHADVRVVVSLSGAASTNDGPALESVLYLSGMDDRVMGYSFPSVGITVCPLGSLTVLDGYDFTPGPPKVKKRVVGIAGGGHLVPTDLCQKNSNGKNGMEEAVAGKVCGVDSAVIIGLPFLFDCGNLKDYKPGVAATNYATTAALEETLHCKDRRKAFQDIKTKQPVVGELKEAL